MIEFDESENKKDDYLLSLEARIISLEKLCYKGDKSVIPISQEQRKLVYLLIKKIAKHIGHTDEEMKKILKEKYCIEKNIDTFSLSNTSKENTTQFIDFLNHQIIEQETQLTEQDILIIKKTKQIIENETKNNKCVICGWSGIIGTIKNKKICLCNEHILEYKENNEKFIKKYILEDYFL